MKSLYRLCLDSIQREMLVSPRSCACVPWVAALSASAFPRAFSCVVRPLVMSSWVACPLTLLTAVVWVPSG